MRGLSFPLYVKELPLVDIVKLIGTASLKAILNQQRNRATSINTFHLPLILSSQKYIIP